VTDLTEAFALAIAHLAIDGDAPAVQRLLMLAADPAALAAAVANATSGVATFAEDDNVAQGKVDAIRGRDADRLYRIYSGLDPIPVTSTNVASIAWDETQRLLFVRFLSGSLYAYSVPATLFIGMASAPSKGKFVWDKIRGADGRRPARLLDLDRRYDYVKIE